MKQYLAMIVTICLLSSLFPFDSQAFFKRAKVTVFVVGEDGKPLSGVNAGVAFEKNSGGGTNVSPQDTNTNAEGKATFSGQCNGHIAYGAEMEGYYPSYYDYDYRELGALGWQPWNPEFRVVMRKIMKPVAMYARDTGEPHNGILIPVVGQDVGFDLIEYDWLAPYGRGKEADFIFHLDSKSIASRNYDFKLKIKFKEGNGIIKIMSDLSHGSEFALPRYAPDDGYEKSLNVHVRRSPDSPIERSENRKNHYIFRVRSVIKDGKVVSAMYGKILRDIWMHPLQDDKARFEFKYYLNPDGTRNLEYDPKRNLFGKLPPLERVGIK